MPGQLFTNYFLEEGILHTAAWQESLSQPADLDAFRTQALTLLEKAGNFHSINEASTEMELIRPLFDLLGWNHYLPQQGSDQNQDIPDHLLFGDASSKDNAATKPAAARYPDALAVAESKRFNLPLDAREGKQTGSPHGQILRYLATADINSDGRIRWGILTNGRIWRLYDRRALPRASGYYEVDLNAALNAADGAHSLRAFRLLFGRPAFSPQHGAQTSFLEDAIAEGRRYEEQVASDLSGTVFDKVYPALVRALAGKSGAELETVRQAALIFLYRLLFLLYAEDRDLLPVNDSRYDDYGLRKSVRDDIDNRIAAGDAFSTVAANYYNHITTLCRQVDAGDASIGLPPYNGGLFAQQAAPMLEQVSLSDHVLAPIIHNLSRTRGESGRRFVNYRDMTVQQLGSIYERLLEREPVRTPAGEIVVRPNSYARKDSGSFYTPQPLVDLIVERTLTPLLEERKAAFHAKAAALQSDTRAKADRIADLRPLDPAAAALDLKVLDPAMGSGHFLVTAVDFLSDAIADLVEYAPTAAPWLEDAYTSPLLDRIAAIRADILARADAANWVIDRPQLTDQAIIRRMVLKRCIYGVDKNPLTVELAKVSLWLHSFTVGAPLSFLDHHLRCGDSLIGLRVRDAARELSRLGGFTSASAIQAAENAAAGMQQIEEMSDADISEVEESAALFREVEKTTAPLRGLLNTLCGVNWLAAGMKKKQRSEFEAPLQAIIVSQEEKAFPLLSNGPDHVDAADPVRQHTLWPEFTEIWRAANDIAGRETFLHWEVAFPGVWRRWQDDQPTGGFDAIIGNPPWDRIKLQEVEWFATRSPELALAPTAAARRRGIKQLRQQGDPLAADFDAAKLRADRLGQLIRASGHYPLLGGGDINLYSLFVERAMRLAKPDGIVGLLTPSGIYADKTAARFFKSVSTSGRVGGLFDFENRRLGTDLPPFFPDVDSRFKFCALIFGGEERLFPQTDCAFFLHDTAAIDDPDRCFPLAPADFARVNPNTGTAPVFRTRRDADITRRIYERHPVLVDRSGDDEVRAWPVQYLTMFHMTNDSHLFRTAAQLDAAGFYPVEGNRWKKGGILYLPLYEGKMVQAFDHRAASVEVNPENLNRPAQPRIATIDELSNPKWLPDPQFWVDTESYDWHWPLPWALGFKEITASTNHRTMIASLFPRAAFGNKTPIFLPVEGDVDEVTAKYKNSAALLVANFNCMAFDFIARQKVHGQTLNLYIVEQLPVIAPTDYDRAFGSTTARDLVRHHVLRLTFTAHDMAPFARDLGYHGPPFIWNQEKRRHLRARLDALYFHLYGLSKDDAAYILDTFPIVRRHDKAAFGTYRTKHMVLAYYNALAAGDTNTDVAL
ncbi:MAG: hypothetical protein OXF50_05565 [Caldilineaceae bacterium]|nr:hypothetical protein [Caldilineaceae bacterium]